MDPILKWPGGKRSELSMLRPLLPAHDRLVEPFAGGAAVFCALEPNQALLNDADTDLIGLYHLVAAGTSATVSAFIYLADAWEAVRQSARAMAPGLAAGRGAPGFDAEREAALVVRATLAQVRAGTGLNPFLSESSLGASLRKGLVGKLGRIAASVTPFPEADAREQLVAGLLAGFYTNLRDRFVASSLDEAGAVFWFLREMCYGSLFRYNRAGRFNIPYGGASYNSKDLRTKVDALLSPETHALFGRATLSAQDFRDFFEAYAGGRLGDLVFLDPPYDTSFSAYGNRAFGVREQHALADIIAALRAPTLLVTKRTEAIEELYRERVRRNSAITLGVYGNTYGVNIKSRFGRLVEHLVVANFELPGSITRI